MERRGIDLLAAGLVTAAMGAV